MDDLHLTFSPEIDDLRGQQESLASWEHRQQFLRVHWGRYPIGRLNQFSYCFTNALRYACGYPKSLMDELSPLAVDVARANAIEDGDTMAKISSNYLRERMEEKKIALFAEMNYMKKLQIHRKSQKLGSSDSDQPRKSLEHSFEEVVSPVKYKISSGKSRNVRSKVRADATDRRTEELSPCKRSKGTRGAKGTDHNTTGELSPLKISKVERSKDKSKELSPFKMSKDESTVVSHERNEDLPVLERSKVTLTTTEGRQQIEDREQSFFEIPNVMLRKEKKDDHCQSAPFRLTIETVGTKSKVTVIKKDEKSTPDTGRHQIPTNSSRDLADIGNVLGDKDHHDQLSDDSDFDDIDRSIRRLTIEHPLSVETNTVTKGRWVSTITDKEETPNIMDYHGRHVIESVLPACENFIQGKRVQQRYHRDTVSTPSSHFSREFDINQNIIKDYSGYSGGLLDKSSQAEATLATIRDESVTMKACNNEQGLRNISENVKERDKMLTMSADENKKREITLSPITLIGALHESAEGKDRSENTEREQGKSSERELRRSSQEKAKQKDTCTKQAIEENRPREITPESNMERELIKPPKNFRSPVFDCHKRYLRKQMISWQKVQRAHRKGQKLLQSKEKSEGSGDSKDAKKKVGNRSVHNKYYVETQKNLGISEGIPPEAVGEHDESSIQGVSRKLSTSVGRLECQSVEGHFKVKSQKKSASLEKLDVRSSVTKTLERKMAKVVKKKSWKDSLDKAREVVTSLSPGRDVASKPKSRIIKEDRNTEIRISTSSQSTGSRVSIASHKTASRVRTTSHSRESLHHAQQTYMKLQKAMAPKSSNGVTRTDDTEAKYVEGVEEFEETKDVTEQSKISKSEVKDVDVQKKDSNEEKKATKSSALQSPESSNGATAVTRTEDTEVKNIQVEECKSVVKDADVQQKDSNEEKKAAKSSALQSKRLKSVSGSVSDTDEMDGGLLVKRPSVGLYSEKLARKFSSKVYYPDKGSQLGVNTSKDSTKSEKTESEKSTTGSREVIKGKFSGNQNERDFRSTSVKPSRPGKEYYLHPLEDKKEFLVPTAPLKGPGQRSQGHDRLQGQGQRSQGHDRLQGQGQHNSSRPPTMMTSGQDGCKMKKSTSSASIVCTGSHNNVDLSSKGTERDWKSKMEKHEQDVKTKKLKSDHAHGTSYRDDRKSGKCSSKKSDSRTETSKLKIDTVRDIVGETKGLETKVAQPKAKSAENKITKNITVQKALELQFVPSQVFRPKCGKSKAEPLRSS